MASGDLAATLAVADTIDRTFRQVKPNEMQVIFVAVRSTMVNGKKKRGIFFELARQLNLNRATVSRQWHTMEKSLHDLLINHPGEEPDAIIHRSHHILFKNRLADKRKGKFKHDREALRERIRAIGLKARRTRRQLAGKLDLPLSTVHWLVRERHAYQGPKLLYGGTIARMHSSSLKPTLTNANKLHRLLYAMDQLKPGGLSLRVPKFQDQMDKVHLDEKWFWLCQDGEKYILVDDEPAPHRTTKHKSYIEKVMFLCAQARPRWDYYANKMWDGKIGIWPIGQWALAQRASIHRPRGTPVWKNESCDKVRYTEMVLDLVIPAILEKWPAGELADPHIKIRIQQDNAPAHPKVDDPFMLGEIAKLWDPDHVGVLTPGKIELYAQPPNSPDCNILDLGLFNAIQSAYWVHSPKNSGDIIKMVEETYNGYPWQKVDRIFVTLQSIFDSIIVAHGGNEYSITHMNKDKLERQGMMPRELVVTQDAIDTIIDFNNLQPNDLLPLAPPAPPIDANAPLDPEFVAQMTLDLNAVIDGNGDGDSSCADFGIEGDRIMDEIEAGII
jgi:hypothetical protein